MIVRLELGPESVLSEAALSSRLGIGRTPIREALQRLSREGLVRILPRKGILVSDMNPRRQLLLLELRRELERLLARKAALRRDEAERAQFQAIADAMGEAARRNDDLSFIRRDNELNQLMATAARNEYAASAARSFQGLSRRFWFKHYREAADLPLVARLHAEQSQAIALGDAEAAARASDSLIDYVEAFTRATLASS